MKRVLTFKNYNIADWFSFYRIAISPLLLFLIWQDLRLFFSWLLLVSYSTDAIDGFLARKLNLVSARGSQLDSMGDQITLAVGLVALYWFETQFIKDNLTLIIIAFIPYLIQMVIAYFKYGKATSFHTYLAKSSAIVQSVFILWALFFNPEYVLFYGMIAIGLLETFEEITLIFMHSHWVSDIKGIYWVIKSRKQLKKSKISS